MATLLTLVSGANADRIGTYNIRYDNPGDRKSGNAWEQRAPVVAGIIRFHDFDIVGTQEGFRHQVDDLRKLLPDHLCSTHGRDNGAEQGEQIAIFFKKDLYELAADGCFWLSETPDKPSKGWDAGLRRICGWAQFKPKSGGDPFYVFSVHFDHRGEQARQESAKLLLAKVDEIAGNAPAFVLGDFNADQNSTTYRLLEDSPRLADTFRTSEFRFAPNGTANRFDAASMTSSRIDHVFAPEGAAIARFGILTDTYRVAKSSEAADQTSGNFPKEVKFGDFEIRLPSDHYPVLVETR
ncbi:endonuclease/exonuclease/phosphatase family protein [Haloferula helveola]